MIDLHEDVWPRRSRKLKLCISAPIHGFGVRRHPVCRHGLLAEGALAPYDVSTVLAF